MIKITAVIKIKRKLYNNNFTRLLYRQSQISIYITLFFLKFTKRFTDKTK